jgi:hypothetical protein
MFKPDLDPTTTTDPLNSNTDNDKKDDGEEDINFNGRVDSGESNPGVWDVFDQMAMPWIPLLLMDD